MTPRVKEGRKKVKEEEGTKKVEGKKRGRKARTPICYATGSGKPLAASRDSGCLDLA